MTTWNKAQAKAITTRNKNILVSASAGSGKTAVLIERLTQRVINDQIDIDHILAMTFTEAAAQEMKKRLAAQLYKHRLESKQDQIKAYIDLQLSKLETAHISTIHSFCLSIIQDFYYLIDLDPKRILNVLDPNHCNSLKQAAIQKVMSEELHTLDDDFVACSKMFSARSEDTADLIQTILSLATLASSKSDPQGFLTSINESYQTYQKIDDLPSDLSFYFFDYLQVQYDIYAKTMEAIKKLYEEQYPSEVKKMNVFMNKYNGLADMEACARNHDYEGYRNALINLARVIVPTTPDKEDKVYDHLRKKVQGMEDTLLANLHSEICFLKDMEEERNIILKITDLVIRYLNYYEDEKYKENGIDFDDMEHFALKILKQENHIAVTYYQKKFEEIMVDEFQDSNDVQDELVKLIAREHNIFRVGDIKQSIYGFRHARPQLMKRLIDNHSKQDEIIYLSNNYRSKKMIVDFNNELYQTLMNIKGLTCSYEKQDVVEIGVEEQLKDNQKICFHALNREALRLQANYNIQTSELKASYIANQISLQHENTNYQWKDFVVLVRSNALKEDMRKAFDDCNIPYFIDVKNGFFESQGVSIILSCLRCLVDPDDDIAFCATLMSPLFNFDANDLALAKLNKDQHQSYYAYFKDNPKLLPLITLVQTASTLSLCEVMNEIFNLNDYYQENTSAQDKTNLDLLYQMAAHNQKDKAYHILSFLNEMNENQESATAEGIPIGNEDDVVRVMSIHQSKGLQYPVVYLWSNSNQMMMENKNFLIQDSDLGVAIKHMQLPERYLRTGIHRIAIEHKINREALEEEMRILYVASTRAQNEMHIVDCVNDLNLYKNDISLADIYERNGYTSWILLSLCHHHKAYFKTIEINKLWEKLVYEPSQQTQVEIPRYPFTSSEQIESSPTQSRLHIPVLDLHPNLKGLNKGIMYHTLIEKLKYDDYSKASMLLIAKQNNFTLMEEDIDCLMKLHEHALFKEVNHYEKVYHELPFIVKDQEQIIHGVIDFMAINKDHIIIIDFKSDHASAASLIENYQEQLKTYQHCIAQLYPDTKIIAYLYSLVSGEMIEIKA
ncbi:MAG: UvrD-helicase domain-containing protein [Erysipelotrichaceae bacterium]